MLVPIKIKSLNPDYSQYKVYDILYEPENLEVQLEIPDKEVSVESNNYFVTEDGLKAIVSKLADLTVELNKQHLKQLNK